MENKRYELLSGVVCNEFLRNSFDELEEAKEAFYELTYQEFRNLKFCCSENDKVAITLLDIETNDIVDYLELEGFKFYVDLFAKMREELEDFYNEIFPNDCYQTSDKTLMPALGTPDGDKMVEIIDKYRPSNLADFDWFNDLLNDCNERAYDYVMQFKDIIYL